MATRTVLVTPRGRAIFPRLTTPDTKFKPEGEYSCKVAIPTVAAEALTAQLDEAYKAAQVQALKENPKLRKVKEADLPYKLNPENEDETVINIKMKASFKDKQGETVTMRPALYDAKGKPLPKDVRIGGGSIVRVSFEPVMFYTATVGAGITLRLKAVQVIDLKTYGGGSAEDYGFETEEGYEAEEPAAGGGFPVEQAAPAPTAPAGDTTGADF